MIEPGSTLSGRYQLKATLGEGGMANVYLAHDLILDRDVAVKVLRLDLQSDPDTVRRFQREAMATSELIHPNIVSIYDVGESNDQQFLVMEYVHGTNLKRYIGSHFPIPYQRVVTIMGQILSAIQLAHDHHIIHRDLKPQNIMIDDNGDAKITDFGIAVALTDSSMTQTNSLLGTVHYLSPEQARGSLPTRQSDIYALGIILFELLTGQVPFEGESAVSVALKHFQEQIPSVRDFDPRIPQALENVILKATTKDPADRYTSAEAMNVDLQTALSASRAKEAKFVVPLSHDLDQTKVLTPLATDTITKSQVSEPVVEAPAEPKKKRWWQHYWPVLLALAVVVMIGAGFAWAFSGGQRDVAVPDLQGMTQKQAQSTLEAAELKLGAISRTTSKTVAKDRVIRSDPQYQSSVKQGSAVALVISSGQSRTTVHDYVGQAYAEAAADLREAGFVVNRVDAASDTVAKGLIVAQDLAPGKRVVADQSTITLTVSTGKSTFELANLVGTYTEKAAKDYAEMTGLTLDVVEDYSDTVTEGMVAAQQPAAGTDVTKGMAVTVTISKGKRPVAQDYVKTVTLTYLPPVTGSSSASSESQSESSADGDSDSSSADHSSESSAASSSVVLTPNEIEIYVGDNKRKIDELAERLSITKTQAYTITFKLNPGELGRYRIVNNGKVVEEGQVQADDGQ